MPYSANFIDDITELQNTIRKFKCEDLNSVLSVELGETWIAGP